MENVEKNIQNPQVFLAEAEALVKGIYVGAIDLQKQYEQLRQLMLAKQVSMTTKENTPPERDDYDYVKDALSHMDHQLVEAVRKRLFDHSWEMLKSLGISTIDLSESKCELLNWFNQNCAEDIVLRIMKGEKPLKRD